MSEKEQILQPLNKNFKEPKLRFPEFKNEWIKIKLCDITMRLRQKNKDNYPYLPLTISAQEGLISQFDYYDKQIASLNLSTYYIIQKGQFAYNKSYSNGYPYGAIKRLNNYDIGVLSSLYICFQLKRTNSDYICFYFDSNKWNKEVRLISGEGARNHGLLNLSADDFFNISLFIPNYLEQEKISKFLLLLYKKIELLESKISILKKYKKGIKKIALKHIALHGEKKNFLDMFDEYKEINKNNYSQYTVGKHGLTKIDELNYDLSKHLVFSEKNLLMGIGIEEIAISKKDKGCVSPVYTVYSINDSLDNNYFYWFLKDLLIIQKRFITKKSTRREFEIDKKELNKCKIAYVMDAFIKSSISTLNTIDFKTQNYERQLFLIKNIKSKIIKDMFI